MRTCSDCTMCCKILGVKELNKEPNENCVHCNAGKGCQIYETRPQTCREFNCLWLQNELMPEEMRPDRTHVVLSVPTDGESLVALVDEKRPDAYLKGPTGDLVRYFSRKTSVLVVVGEKRKVILPGSQV